jgi:DNA-directed RNA polymerase subunit L
VTIWPWKSKQLRKHLAVDEEVGVLVLDENDVTLCCYLRGALAHQETMKFVYTITPITKELVLISSV